MKLFAEEKRTELLKIKIKPKVLKKALDLWFLLYPHSEEPNFDDLFQEMIIEACKAKNLITIDDLPEHLREEAMRILANEQNNTIHMPQVVTNYDNGGKVEDSVTNLLR
jgi:hypothetical protein